MKKFCRYYRLAHNRRRSQCGIRGTEQGWTSSVDCLNICLAASTPSLWTVQLQYKMGLVED